MQSKRMCLGESRSYLEKNLCPAHLRKEAVVSFCRLHFTLAATRWATKELDTQHFKARIFLLNRRTKRPCYHPSTGMSAQSRFKIAAILILCDERYVTKVSQFEIKINGL